MVPGTMPVQMMQVGPWSGKILVADERYDGKQVKASDVLLA